MKRILTYLTLIMLLGGAAACTDDADDPASGRVAGEEVKAVIGVELDGDQASSAAGAPTRVFCDRRVFDASKASVILLAFDENHLLTNVYEGTYVETKTKSSIDNERCHYYSVTLKTTDRPRILHVVVNHNSLKPSDIPFGSESDIFDSDVMTVGDNQDAYWGRLEMPNGISADAQEVSQALSHFVLVRNFCKVAMTLSANAQTHLRDAEWGMMAIPTRGSVAPYLKEQSFADFFNEGTSTIQSYKDLTAQGYYGHVPRTTANKDTFYRLTSVDDAAQIAWQPVDSVIYTYENEGSSGSSMWHKSLFFLRAHYVDDDGTVDSQWTYYRMSLVNPDDNYLPLNMLRNILYDITVGNVYDRGYASAAEAYSRADANNISGSTITGSFTNIMSGKAILRVEYIKKYILSPAQFTMEYRYVPDITRFDANNYYVTDNDAVVLKKLDGTYNVSDLPAAITDADYALKGYSIASTNIDGDNLGHRLITFTPNRAKKGEEEISSTVRVAVRDGTHADLYRDVEFILRERYRMQNLRVYNDPAEENAYICSFDVPANLPKELFPLQISFETSPTYAYPNSKKEVMEVTGTEESLIYSGDKSYFHYHRRISYAEFGNKVPTEQAGGFIEENGYKRITIFFRVNRQLLHDNGTENNYIKFAVYCDYLSPDPDADLDNAKPGILKGKWNFTRASKDNALDYQPTAEVDWDTPDEYK